MSSFLAFYASYPMWIFSIHQACGLIPRHFVYSRWVLENRKKQSIYLFTNYFIILQIKIIILVYSFQLNVRRLPTFKLKTFYFIFLLSSFAIKSSRQINTRSNTYTWLLKQIKKVYKHSIWYIVETMRKNACGKKNRGKRKKKQPKSGKE